MADTENPSSERSIHWRQRWWYVTWVLLLLGALGFWAWWETPAIRGTGHVVFKVWVQELPAGSRVEAWVGPTKQWNLQAQGFQGPWTVTEADKPLPIPPLEIHVGLRHWRQGYIPRLSGDLIVLRLDAPSGPPRFIAYDLRADLNSGTAGPHRRLYVSGPLRWGSLSTDATHPTPLLP